jgi:hypothetical protein
MRWETIPPLVIRAITERSRPLTARRAAGKAAPMPLRSIRFGRLSLPLACAILIAAPLAASAAPASEVIRPGTHEQFFIFSVGPALAVSDSITQVKLTQAYGYHFTSNASGLALGAEIQESFGHGFFTLELGPKIWYDLALSSELGVYLTPNGMIGMALQSGGGQTNAYFDMQFGFALRMVLNDKVLLSFSPFSLDIAIGDITPVRYDLMFGIGICF